MALNNFTLPDKFSRAYLTGTRRVENSPKILVFRFEKDAMTKKSFRLTMANKGSSSLIKGVTMVNTTMANKGSSLLIKGVTMVNTAV